MSDTDFDQARVLFFEGTGLLAAGRPQDAEAAFARSLALLPGRASTLMNLGVARLRQGLAETALQALDASVEAGPGIPDAWGHRAAALSQLGRHAEALQALDQAVQLGALPQAVAWHRAESLAALGRHAEAVAALDTLLAVEPGHGASWVERGRLLQCLNRHDEALQSYRRGTTLAPALPQGWSLLGQLLKDQGRRDEAAAAFERALEHGAEPALHRWFLAAVRGDSTPTQAPPEYVQRLFDGYADEYDQHLVGALRYRTPFVLCEMLRTAHPAPLDQALDLGCGTGLAAEALAQRAAVLDGVDLSAGMLDKARALGRYRTLAQADVAAHLASTEARYDLVFSADVFIYVGALEAVFDGVRRVLRPGGLFSFSVEDSGGPPLLLRGDSLRYAHGEAYLRELAAARGFSWLALQRDTLREDQGRPVQGLFVLLAAAGTAA